MFSFHYMHELFLSCGISFGENGLRYGRLDVIAQPRCDWSVRRDGARRERS